MALTTTAGTATAAPTHRLVARRIMAVSGHLTGSFIYPVLGLVDFVTDRWSSFTLIHFGQLFLAAAVSRSAVEHLSSGFLSSS